MAMGKRYSLRRKQNRVRRTLSVGRTDRGGKGDRPVRGKIRISYCDSYTGDPEDSLQSLMYSQTL